MFIPNIVLWVDYHDILLRSINWIGYFLSSSFDETVYDEMEISSK